jgi:hypothetical protein
MSKSSQKLSKSCKKSCQKSCQKKCQKVVKKVVKKSSKSFFYELCYIGKGSGEESEESEGSEEDMWFLEQVRLRRTW